MSQLASGKAQDIFEGFGKLLDQDVPSLDLIPKKEITAQFDLEKEFCRFASVHLLHVATGFWRRIVVPCNEFPLKLLVLQKAPMEQAS